jgi:hypothetical protein
MVLAVDHVFVPGVGHSFPISEARKNMYRRYVFVAMLALLVASTPRLRAQESGPAQLPTLTEVTPGTPGPISGPAALAMQQGALPIDAAALEQQKAAAADEAGLAAPETQEVTPLAVTVPPTITLAKEGIRDPNRTPPDTTGAIGTQRYVETVNSKVAIYDRALNLTSAPATLNAWWGQPSTANSFDPQVIWDATTNRFYYTGDTIFSSTSHVLSYGFSKNAAPNNATTDWCQYQINYGSEFPDYPKLGDSTHFAIIGVNTFGPSSFRGSDIMAISKPGSAALTTCPSATSFKFGIRQNLFVGNAIHFTPTPASAIDPLEVGWIVTRPGALPNSSIGLFRVDRDPTTGDPRLSAPGVLVNTGVSYTVPANAPQPGTAKVLDTLDARFTQAVMAFDPTKLDANGKPKVGLWTQHTINGGAGARVKWYEINPPTATLLRSGAVQSTSTFYFNGAISPDRVVNGTTRAYGGSMGMHFSASSKTRFPAIEMVDKRGDNTQSVPRLVKQSQVANVDFSCSGTDNICRWGDYAAATPDPLARLGLRSGAVWGSNQWTAPNPSGVSGAMWRTWNFRAKLD